MLYIHKLHQLNQKSADLECVYLLRELKGKLSLPLSGDQVTINLSNFFVSDTDKERMTKALEQIQPAVEAITGILQERNPVYETINLQRTVNILSDLLPALHNNLVYADGIALWQQQLVPEATTILNKIPNLQLLEEKKIYDQRLQAIFQKILRNNDFRFNARDIVNEGEVTIISDLCESMTNGLFFHIPLEEEIQKKNFAEIKLRIPAEKLSQVEAIRGQLLEIKKGVERAYDMNMRLLTLALHFYAHIKFVTTKL